MTMTSPSDPRPISSTQSLDAMGELIVQFIARGEQIAQRFGVPAFCLKALHVLKSSMAMRDLGRHMHCDPSFVTATADLVEKRGLARREASTADRRIKHLVLTQEGVGLRSKIEREFMPRMPWRTVLDEEERACRERDADHRAARQLTRPGGRAASRPGGGCAAARRQPAASRPSASPRCRRPTESLLLERRGGPPRG